jgi:hypothetical protein
MSWIINGWWFYIGFSVGLAVGVSAVAFAVSMVSTVNRIANKDV